MDDKTIELALANVALVNKSNIHKQILVAHAKYKYDTLKQASEDKEQKK